MKPIPDAALSRIAKTEEPAGYLGTREEMVDGSAILVVPGNLARELLALRQAARDMVEHYCILALSGDCGNWDPEAEDEVRALRALLPESAGAEGGEPS